LSGIGGNVAKSTVIIDTTNAVRSVTSLEGNLKRLDTSTQSAAKSGTSMGNAFTQTQSKITQVDNSIKKMTTDLAGSAKSNLGLQQSFDKTGQSMTKLSGTANALGNAQKKLTDTTNKSINQYNTLMGKVTSTGKTMETTGQKFSKMGGFMKQNLTNVALLSGGLAGLDDQFLQLHKAQVANDRANLMVSKSNQQVAKLQNELNKMVKSGKEGTTEYNLKLKDFQLAQEKAGIANERATVTQENLSEATEDFYTGILPNLIFVGGSVVSMITDMGINMESLGNMATVVKGKLQSLRNVLGGLGGLGGGLLAGALGGAAAIAIIETVTTQVNKFFDTIKAKARTSGNIADAIFDWKKFAADAKAGNAEVDEILSRTGASLLELGARPEEVGKRFLEMGGKIDKTGHIALTARDHFFDLGLGINGVGKTSLMYIEWTKQKIQADEDEGAILKWLTDSLGNAALAQKILTLAKQDAVKQQKQLAQERIQITKEEIDKEVTARQQELKAEQDADADHRQQLEDFYQWTQSLKQKQLEERKAAIDEEVKTRQDAMQKEKEDDQNRIKEQEDFYQWTQKLKAEDLQRKKDAIAEEVKNRQDALKKEQEDNQNQIKEQEDFYQWTQKLKADAIQKQLEQSKAANTALFAQNDALLEQAKSLGVSTAALEKYTATGSMSIEQIAGLNEQLSLLSIAAAREQTDFELGANSIINHNLAMVKGTVAAKDYLMQLKFAKIEEGAWLQEMERKIPVLSQIADQYGLTNQQIQDLIATTQQAGDSFSAFNEEFRKASREWEKADMLKDIFKIKSDPEKLLKDALKKATSKDFRGRLKVNLKLEQKQSDTLDAIRELGRGFFQMSTNQKWEFEPGVSLKVKEKDAKGVFDTMEKLLDNAIKTKGGKKGPYSERFKVISDQLKAAEKKGGQEGIDDLKQIWEQNKDIFGQPTVPISIDEDAFDQLKNAVSQGLIDSNFAVPLAADPASLDALALAVQAGINGTTYTAMVQAQIRLSGGSGKTSTAGGFNAAEGDLVNGKLDIPATASVKTIDYTTLPPDSDIMDTQANVTALSTDSLGTATKPAHVMAVFDWIPNTPENQKKLNDAQSKNPSRSINDNKDNTKGSGDPVTQAQLLQKALESLAKYGVKNLQALAKASKTNFNTVANYADGATTYVQVLQVAVGSIAKFGSNNLKALAKAAKTNFDTVANYANGATGFVQTLQIAIGSIAKYGPKNLKALANAAKTNFDTVANYANGATGAVQALQKAIDNLHDKTVTVTYKQNGSPQSKGGIYSFAEGGMISAAGGRISTVHGPHTFTYGDNPGGNETLAFIPHNNPKPILEKINSMFGNMGDTLELWENTSRFKASDRIEGGHIVNQDISIHVSGNELINERNLNKRIKLTVGQNRDRLG